MQFVCVAWGLVRFFLEFNKIDLLVTTSKGKVNQVAKATKKPRAAAAAAAEAEVRAAKVFQARPGDSETQKPHNLIFQKVTALF
jgi:hypothetical protein